MAPVNMEVDTPEVTKTKQAGIGGSSSLSESSISPPASGSRRRSTRQAKRSPRKPRSDEGSSSRPRRRSASRNKAPKEDVVPKRKEIVVCLAANTDEETFKKKPERQSLRIAKQTARNQPKASNKEANASSILFASGSAASSDLTEQAVANNKEANGSPSLPASGSAPGSDLAEQAVANIDKEANGSPSLPASGSAPSSDLAEQAVANNKEANGSPSFPASGSVPQECDPKAEEAMVVETDAAEVPPAQQVGENSNTKTENTIPPSENIPKEAVSATTAQASSPNQDDQKKPRKARVDDKYANLKLEDLIAEEEHIRMQEILGLEPVAPLPVWECIDDAFLLAPPPFVNEPYIPPRRMHDKTCPWYCFCTPVNYMEF